MRKYIYSLILFYTFSFSSCTDENEFRQNNNLPEAPEGFVNIEFDLNSGAFHKPETKAIRSDSDFDAPWVLSFKLQNQGSPSPDTLFVEAVKAEMAGGKYYMQLSGSSDRHLLYFVANADKVIENKKTLFATKTYGQVMSLLTFGNPSPDANFGLIPLSNPQGSVPFANQNIPMTATAQLDKIVKGTKVSGTVNLQRIVSKIYVDATKANQKNGFILTGLTVIDVPSIGYMNNELNIQSVQPQSIVDYGRKTDSDRLTTLVLENIDNNTTHSPASDRPIYVYPFLENDPRGGVYQVIFSGHFGDNITKYFKIKLGGLNNLVALSKPNTSFLINIESIANSGYVSLEHALQYEPSTGVVAKVTLIETSHEIIANEQHFLGISNSEFQLYDSGISEIETVATITTNAFNAGFPAASAHIDLVSSNGVELVTNAISSNSTDIRVKFNSDECEAVIRITIGKLSKNIKIKKGLTPINNYGLNESGFLLSRDILSAEITYGENIGISEAKITSDKQVKIYNPNSTSLYFFQNRSLYTPEGEIKAFKNDGAVLIIRFKYNEGIAGSNIYWDGTKLTFDDVPAKGKHSPNALFQGVFFNWGSLVAYGNKSQQSWSYLYSPSSKPYPDDLKNLSWASFITTALKSVPNLTNIPSGSILSEQYIMQHHNPEQNVGDICKYITDMGWAPSGKWRLPTRIDFLFTENKYSITLESAPISYNPNGTTKPSSYASYENLIIPFSGTVSWTLDGGNSNYMNSSNYLHLSYPVSTFETSRSRRGLVYKILPNNGANFCTIRCIKYK